MFFKKLTKGLFSIENPFIVYFFSQFMHLRLSQIKNMSISWIKKPILCFFADFYCLQAHPMISYSKHETNNQRLKSIISFKVVN